MGFSFLHQLSTTRALQIFQVFRLGAVVLTSVLFAKSGLSTADIGAYEMLLYIGVLFTFLWVNGLLQGMTPVYAQLDEAGRKSFIFNNFLVFCGLSALLFLVLVGGQKWMIPFLTGQPELPHYTLFCTFLLLNVPSLPVEYIYLLREQARQIVVWGGVVFGLQVAVFFIPLWLGMGMETSFLMLAVLGAGKFLWTLSLVLRVAEIRIDMPLLRRYLVFSGPLMANLFVGNLILLFDNWLVGWYYQDTAVFAVFRYGSREFPLAVALATALATAMIPRLSASPEKGMAEMKDKTRRLMHLLFPLTILLLFVSKPLFPLVFNPDFAASAGLFNIYLLITASRVLLPNAIVLSRGFPAAILRVGIAELLIKIVLGFLFIHWFGLPGVAWSAVLAFFWEKLGLIWFLEKKQGVKTSEWLDIQWYVIYVGLLAAAFCISFFTA